MKNIKYTIKVKDEHNPPEFKLGLGKGVISTQVINFNITDEDFDSAKFQAHIFELAEKMLHDWFEVVPEIVDDEDI